MFFTVLSFHQFTRFYSICLIFSALFSYAFQCYTVTVRLRIPLYHKNRTILYIIYIYIIYNIEFHFDPSANVFFNCNTVT